MMDPYDPKLAPKPFGLHNTGALCYFNSFLQILASCTSFTRQVLKNKDLMRRTITGKAMLEFCEAYAEEVNGELVVRAAPTDNIMTMSSRVFGALFSDLKERRPLYGFGTGQDDVRMLVDAFIDMLELTADGKDPLVSAEGKDVAVENAVTQLFRHKYNLTIRCLGCGRVHHPPPESSMSVFLIRPKRKNAALPTTPKEFASWIRRNAVWNEGYKCVSCSQKSKCITEYNLAIVPEILLCSFELKTDEWSSFVRPETGVTVPAGSASGCRVPHYFPETFEQPAIGGGAIKFRLVGQAEHSGGNSSGHYWARALRGEGVYRLNDSNLSPDTFGLSAETYLIAYHYDGFVPPSR